jgi:hypothetical protein
MGPVALTVTGGSKGNTRTDAVLSPLDLAFRRPWRTGDRHDPTAPHPQRRFRVALRDCTDAGNESGAVASAQGRAGASEQSSGPPIRDLRPDRAGGKHKAGLRGMSAARLLRAYAPWQGDTGAVLSPLDLASLRASTARRPFGAIGRQLLAAYGALGGVAVLRPDRSQCDGDP